MRWIMLIAGLCWLGSVSVASAGGYSYHGSNNFWPGFAAGTALGVLGTLAARPYTPQPAYPAYPYPPVVVQAPRYATYFFCPASGMYYPYTTACPAWQPVQVQY